MIFRRLDNNHLSGLIPESIGNLSNLVILYASNNLFFTL